MENAAASSPQRNPYQAQNILQDNKRPNDLALLPNSALELLVKQKQDQTRIPLLPSAPPWLQLRPGCIYELSGPAGSGKTQLALQCCMNADQFQVYYLSLQGSQAKVATLGYRLGQMCENEPQTMQRIHLIAVHNEDDCLTVLGNIPQTAGMIVMDSIADIFRSSQDYMERSESLFAVAQHLRSRKGTVALVLNQVSFEKTPALGLAWANCVTTSLQVVAGRWIQVHHSPEYPRAKARFEIDTQGCRLVAASQSP